MKEAFLEWLKQLIADNNTHPFYVSKEWRGLSTEVLHEQKECQICKHHRRWGPAQVVHHRFPVRKYPEWALSKFTPSGEINLIALCRECHENLERPKRRYMNVERW